MGEAEPQNKGVPPPPDAHAFFVFESVKKKKCPGRTARMSHEKAACTMRDENVYRAPPPETKGGPPPCCPKFFVFVCGFIFYFCCPALKAKEREKKETREKKRPEPIDRPMLCCDWCVFSLVVGAARP